ncbi:unnamed protein product [Vitrella brassicaformis CCMP3155]|uniref:Secreted protein n=1 Tax=Vitrella brassicaformis (strain CCMP3155) TaxID=1169540 RepID=A0A0G4ECU7_VITBC|nr:unnamed protein product [Vitrella brassicaformis CCMP3155]|eukprot:CEL93137.1 unnamed protein product [Vitrella brassicaformis CCMP3155]
MMLVVAVVTAFLWHGAGAAVEMRSFFVRNTAHHHNHDQTLASGAAHGVVFQCASDAAACTLSKQGGPCPSGQECVTRQTPTEAGVKASAAHAMQLLQGDDPMNQQIPCTSRGNREFTIMKSPPVSQVNQLFNNW